MASVPKLYDPVYDAWPDLRRGRIVLAPVRNGVDRRTGRLLNGRKHVDQSMVVIFSTRFHERVLRRWVGSFVPHMIGENVSERTILRFYYAIMASIEIWEPNFRFYHVRIKRRSDTSGPEEDLTSAEELRKGHLTTKNHGVYRPRAHLGDETAEERRTVGIIGMGHGHWETQR